MARAEKTGFGWSRQPLWLWLVIPGLGGLLSAAYRILAHVTEGAQPDVVDELASELTAIYAVALLIYLWLPIARRLRPYGPQRWRNLALHVPVLIGFSALHTSLNWALRTLLWPLIGLGTYDYGRMPLRYAMEFPADLIGYAIAVILVSLLDRFHVAHERELALSRLEARFAEARLHRLRGQLQPHFLFNTLNTVSSVMYDDVERADRVLADLGELLRRALEREDAAEVPLDDELETLDLYVDIMRARFQDRLEVEVDAEPGTGGVPVPILLLQPLVENALRHGQPPDAASPLRVEIRARRHGGALEVTVSDRGPGLAGSVEAALSNGGIGLRNSVERLRGLHGERASLDLIARDGGGLTVRVRLPWR
jgi:hypothetical protein